MFKFKNLTPVNGLDQKDLVSAKQNNYVWSMAELGDYIYIGTGRNVISSMLRALASVNVPISIGSSAPNDTGEIWRYKKGSEGQWEKVFRGLENIDVGFRSMISHKSFYGNEALYASSFVFSGSTSVYKTISGGDWKKVSSIDEEGQPMQGSSSRGMVSHKGRLYIGVSDDFEGRTLLYSSRDPEFYDWKLETPSGTDSNKNPQGNISNIIVFNDRIYVTTSTDTEVQIWRTNGCEPEVDEWTLIRCFEGTDNWMAMDVGIFKNHLYVSACKEFPLTFAFPRGCDIVRIDKDDNWEVIVGPDSVSGICSGFFNPFNVYAWQMKEYNDKLLVTTCDDSINMQVIIECLLLNKEELPLPEEVIDILIKVYELVVLLLNELDYPFGFDMYVSEDGKNFEPILLDGLGNKYNYGARRLYVDSKNDLYIGTANPYQGLEVWKAKECHCSCGNYYDKKSYGYKCKEEVYKYKEEVYKYKKIKEEMESYFVELEEYMPQIKQFLPKLINKVL